MRTYRPVRSTSGTWRLEWFVDGLSQGLVWGWFHSEGEAAMASLDLIQMERREAATELRYSPRRPE